MHLQPYKVGQRVMLETHMVHMGVDDACKIWDL